MMHRIKKFLLTIEVGHDWSQSNLQDKNLQIGVQILKTVPWLDRITAQNCVDKSMKTFDLLLQAQPRVLYIMTKWGELNSGARHIA
jgi:hypothetical protein